MAPRFTRSRAHGHLKRPKPRCGFHGQPIGRIGFNRDCLGDDRCFDIPRDAGGLAGGFFNSNVILVVFRPVGRDGDHHFKHCDVRPDPCGGHVGGWGDCCGGIRRQTHSRGQRPDERLCRSGQADVLAYRQFNRNNPMCLFAHAVLAGCSGAIHGHAACHADLCS